MESIINVLTYLASNWQVVLGLVAGVGVAFLALIKAIIMICVLIPGEQPEKFLQAIVDFCQKYVDWVQSVSKKSPADPLVK